MGSPPRVRGKDYEELKDKLDDRITPACAGKRWINVYDITVHWDHPRVCGEKDLYFYHDCTSLGSPPRVRGKVDV